MIQFLMGMALGAVLMACGLWVWHEPKFRVPKGHWRGNRSSR